MVFRASIVFGLLLIGAAAQEHAAPAPAPTLHAQIQLLSTASVDGDGIYFDQVVAPSAPAQNSAAWPRIRLADPPTLGQTTTLQRTQILAILQREWPDLAHTNWSGADTVRIQRRSRSLPEDEVKELLTAALQSYTGRDAGDLEIRLTRAWRSLLVPDDPLRVRIVDMPTSGLSSYFIARFELTTPRESLGTYQLAIQARLYREVLTAVTALTRGQTLSESDVELQRVDVLNVRNTLTHLNWSQGQLEIAEPVQPGAPLTVRSLRPKPVIVRGQLVDALARDGMLFICLQVEALDNGAAGQAIRLRNPKTKRELRGKVIDANSVQILL